MTVDFTMVARLGSPLSACHSQSSFESPPKVDGLKHPHKHRQGSGEYRQANPQTGCNWMQPAGKPEADEPDNEENSHIDREKLFQ